MSRQATDGSLSLEEAVRMLLKEAHPRYAAEILARYCRTPLSEEDKLKKSLTGLLLTSTPEAKPDTIRRTVSRWIANKTQLLEKEYGLKFAFALGLNSRDAGDMLWRLCGEGFHGRDPEDIIWMFALDRKMTYTEARALQERMKPACETAGTNEKSAEVRTESVVKDFAGVTTEEELETFLREHAAELGKLHNTAFELYTGFMELLQEAPTITDNIWEEEEGKKNSYNTPARKMKVWEILSAYLHTGSFPEKDEGIEANAIQKNIKSNWPDESTLSRISKRAIDVPRKVLILLFLATDGGESDYGDQSVDTADDFFQEEYERLATMLEECGYAPIDPRSPFDWMILYCMVTDDAIEMDHNLEEFLSLLYRQEDDPDDDAE